MRLVPQIQHLIQIDKGKITINLFMAEEAENDLMSTAFREMIKHKEKYPNVTINETPNPQIIMTIS